MLFNDYKDLNTQIMLSSSKKAEDQEDQWIVDEKDVYKRQPPKESKSKKDCKCSEVTFFSFRSANGCFLIFRIVPR